ncbi:MAG: nucleotidyltransferase family protein [Nanoarchaeota archaeon]|nr:nucleotidyltransferase family protein [Nanoarchaeota archaeon]
MVYTEIKERNGKKYFYRVISVRNGKKVSKKRKYLGLNLPKERLFQKEQEADKNLIQNKKRESFLDKIKPKIIRILKKNKVKKAGIFGSYARGEQKKNSDIDILIELPKGMGFGFAGLQIELSEKLNKKVDLVTYKGISPYLRDRILKQEIRII